MKTKPFIAAKTDKLGNIHGCFKWWKAFEFDEHDRIYKCISLKYNQALLIQQHIDWAEKFCKPLVKFFDTEQECFNFVRLKDFESKHGRREKPDKDFSCPDCGYDFYAPDSIVCDSSDVFQYERDEEDLTMNCICGKMFTVHLSYSTNVTASFK